MHATERCFGAGLGYRPELHRDIVRHAREIDFLEIMTEDFLDVSPEHHAWLSSLCAGKPVVAHSAEMSLGSAAPAPPGHLERVDRLVQTIGCRWLSEHLSFSSVPEVHLTGEVPLWCTEEALDVVRRNIRSVKEQIHAPFLLENVTSYYQIPSSDMSEADFLARALIDTDSGLLLDINNLHISSLNLSFDPYSFLASIPLERVVQIHIGGGRPIVGMVVNTHGASVHEDVWRLLEYVVRYSPVRGVVLEWDRDFPTFSVLRDHLLHVRHTLRRFGAWGRRN